MKKICFIIYLLVASLACTESSSQQQKERTGVGGRCEGCEAIHESPVPFDSLPSTDTLPTFSEQGERIFISGTVYKRDGKTPAGDVVIYVYHTDLAGNYPTRGDEKGWAKRHGYIRGWLKTGSDGRYGFYTMRPASYPNSNNPQHIHVTIKEPGMNEYWIDEYHFEDDPLFTENMRRHEQKRGGSGIIRLKNTNGLSVGTRDITLGLNVPGYPG
jgi:protocatechuate 3,4-dioxygenase beta subunit